MALTPRQREVLEGLGTVTEDEFLQPQYAQWLVPQMRELREHGEPIAPDDTELWAREQEWPESIASFLAGIAQIVRYSG